MSIGSSSSPVRRIAGGWRGSRVENASASARTRARSTGEDPEGSSEENAAWVAAWSAALDELELDVEQAEALLEQGSANETSDPSLGAALVPSPRQHPPASRAPARARNGSLASGTATRRLADAYNPLPGKHFSAMSGQAGSPANPEQLVAAAREAAAQEAQALAAEVSLSSEHAVGFSGVNQQAWAHDFAPPYDGDPPPEGSSDLQWNPPALPGPMPAELTQRASALLGRQLAVAQSLARAMLGNRQQHGLLERMDHTPNETRSAYFDHQA